MSDRFGMSAKLVERTGKMIVYVWVVGVIGQCPLERGDGQLDLAQLGEHAAQIGPGFDKILVQLDRHVVPFARRRMIGQPIE